MTWRAAPSPTSRRRDAGGPDLVLVNGRVSTLASRGDVPPDAEAVAIGSGRIQAVGTSAEMAAMAGSGTQVVDLEHRRVLPGLVDSHVHFVRAGLTWEDETHWEQLRDVDACVGSIAAAAASRPRGSWIRVVGGWHPGQLAEGRGPTHEDLDRFARDHPVVVQFMYDWGMLNTCAMRALGLTREVADRVDAAAFDRDRQGHPTGVVRGMAALRWLYSRLPVPSFEDQVGSTEALSREFSRVGITGLIDGGGVNTGPEVYGPIYETWRRGTLTTRVRLMVHGSGPGAEAEEYAGYRKYVQPRFGDPLLQVLGLGEIILYAIHDSETREPDLSAETLTELAQIFEQFAACRWPVQVHTMRPETVSAVLDVWEAVDRQRSIRDLRWSLVHGECLDGPMIARLKALGGGVLCPSLFRFAGDEMLEAWGQERLAGAPPLRACLDAQVVVGGGTDAMRVASYNPFAALHWYITGLTVTGNRTRDETNRLTREEALRLYTRAGAWFSFEEHQRGALEPGTFADLIVLDKDYMSVPTEEISTIGVDLTLLGGKSVWASAPFGGMSG